MFTIVNNVVGKVFCTFGYHDRAYIYKTGSLDGAFKPWKCIREGCDCYFGGIKIPPMPPCKPVKES